MLVIVFTASALLASCVGRSPDPVFYSLSPLSENILVLNASGFSIVVGPVYLPAENDRLQIVIRDGENRRRMDEFHRWSGPLDENIASVISENLSRMLGSGRIVPFTGEDVLASDYRLALNINRLDGGLNGALLLDATWSVRKMNAEQPVIVKKSTITEKIEPEGFDGLVAAHNRALASLSREIAMSMKGVD